MKYKPLWGSPFNRPYALLLLTALSVLILLLTAACGTHPAAPLQTANLQNPPPQSVIPASSVVDVRDVNRALTDSEMQDYAGDAACAGCHKQVAALQSHSSHAHTFHLVTSAQDAPAFRASTTLTDTHIKYAYHTGAENGVCLVIGKNKRGQVGKIAAAYALGTGRTGVTYLGEDKNKEHLELRVSYFPKAHTWDFTPGQPEGKDLIRAAGRPLSPRDFQQCLGCHATAVRATPEGADVARSLMNVGCERCHGPGRAHIIEAAKALAATSRAKIPAASGARETYGMEDLRLASPQRITTICGACHRSESPGHPISAGEETKIARLQGVALARSGCYQQSGALSCLTCHNAHSNANPNLSRNDAICLTCHNAQLAAHPATPGAAAANTAQASTATASAAANTTAGTTTAHTAELTAQESSPSTRIVAGKICPVNAHTGCTTCHMPKTAGIMPYSLFTNHWIKVWK